MKSNLGKKFEQQFKQSAEKDGLCIIRFNDTDMSYNNNTVSKFTVKSLCDYEIFKTPYLYLLELKHTINKSIGIQPTPEDPNAMIKAHQINNLIKMSQYEKCVCGFILSYLNEKEDSEDTYFISIQDFSNFLVNEEKHSINKLDCVLYGGIKINQTKKRVYYTYDVKDLLNKLEKFNNVKVNKGEENMN